MKRARGILDIAMTVLLPLLMTYSLIGETFHEAAGTVMLVLFIAHNWMNRGFWKNLFKGKYTAKRALHTAVNLALFAVMIL